MSTITFPASGATDSDVRGLLASILSFLRNQLRSTAKADAGDADVWTAGARGL